MIKKLLVIILVLSMILSLVTACAKKEEKVAFKIGVITGTVSQNEEEFRAAENTKKKYGNMIVMTTYPDNFTQEQETLIANTLSLASDPDVKALVICQSVPGFSAAIDKVREVRPDMLIIAGTPGEDPDIIASKADIVFQADELGMGVAVIEQAKKQGATKFVHYSFPRHMSYQILAMRRDIFKETCQRLGIEFIDATAPDPTGDAGLSGAQQFILEDVPRKVAQLGKNTAFFSTNCGMQEPLIKSTLDQGAIYPQPCCPSPFHGFPGALGIEIPADKKGDIDYVVKEIRSKVAQKGGTGRFSTWPVPVNMMFVEGGVEYAKLYLEGKTNGKLDLDKIKQSFYNYTGQHVKISTFKDEKTNKELTNYLMILSDYVDF